MAKLYYGNGNCSIEGQGVIGIQIHFKGAIIIEDKTPFNYVVNANNNIILIAPIANGEDLSELFDYQGVFKISSIIASDREANKIPISIKKVLDYSEFIDSNSEDMTTKSEDLKQGFASGGRVPKTILRQPNIKNLHTDDWEIELYNKDRTPYEGKFEIVLKNSMAITPNGDELYYKSNGKFTTTKNETGIPANALYRKAEEARLKDKLKTTSNRKRRRSRKY